MEGSSDWLAAEPRDEKGRRSDGSANAGALYAKSRDQRLASATKGERLFEPLNGVIAVVHIDLPSTR